VLNCWAVGEFTKASRPGPGGKVLGYSDTKFIHSNTFLKWWLFKNKSVAIIGILVF
jgi:hypothetical protein